jgi:hypothetical protein
LASYPINGPGRRHLAHVRPKHRVVRIHERPVLALVPPLRCLVRNAWYHDAPISGHDLTPATLRPRRLHPSRRVGRLRTTGPQPPRRPDRPGPLIYVLQDHVSPTLPIDRSSSNHIDVPEPKGWSLSSACHLGSELLIDEGTRTPPNYELTFPIRATGERFTRLLSSWCRSGRVSYSQRTRGRKGELDSSSRG